MRIVRVGWCNLNPTVGAFESNTKKIIEKIDTLAQYHCDIVVFPEQAISGYPAEDLVQWNGFVSKQSTCVTRISQHLRNIFPHIEKTPLVIVGCSVPNDGNVYNAAAVIHDAVPPAFVCKENLPTYGVFYEDRTHTPGHAGMFTYASSQRHKLSPLGDLIFDSGICMLAVDVCEDIWSPSGPINRRSYQGCELSINISASPWRDRVFETRQRMIETRSADNECVVVYVNLSGGQDSLVFDGGTIICQNGTTLLATDRWIPDSIGYFDIDLGITEKCRKENTTWRKSQREWLAKNAGIMSHMVDANVVGSKVAPFVPSEPKFISRPVDKFSSQIRTIALGIRSYFEKSGAFDRIGISLSGGKDSVLSAFICADVCYDMGKDPEDFLNFFSFPTKFNSETTKNIAKLTAAAVGASFVEDSIAEAFERECVALSNLLPVGTEIPKITKQNIQARIRAMRMWNWANARRGLFVQTGNMSETAVGYTTIGGDLMGGYGGIKNLAKTNVIQLLDEYYGPKYPGIVALLMATPASAELDVNQEDEKELMPFVILDACFKLFAGDKRMPEEVAEVLKSQWCSVYKKEQIEEWVTKFTALFMRSIFKWVQSPLSVHLGSLDFDRERALQLPTVSSLEWLTMKDVSK